MKGLLIYKKLFLLAIIIFINTLLISATASSESSSQNKESLDKNRTDSEEKLLCNLLTKIILI